LPFFGQYHFIFLFKNSIKAMEQATHDAEEAGKGGLPIVAHKKSNDGWLVTMRAEDWFRIYREYEAGLDL
jgi:hypothetical protein